MRFIDLRRRLCQDKSELTPTKHKSEGFLLARKSESRTSLNLDLDNFQHKLSLSPTPDQEPDKEAHHHHGVGGFLGGVGRTRSEVFQRLTSESPSVVNIDLSCDNDSGETLTTLTSQSDVSDQLNHCWKPSKKYPKMGTFVGYVSH